MTEGIDEPFTATPLSDNLLNKVTHGSGTTAIRQALGSWAVDRLFFDTDKKTLFRNAGTEDNPVWKHASKNIGGIELFAGPAADIPEGSLVCDGSSVSRTTYADLFALIGVSFGAGDNGNEFKIPDFRDRIPRGSSDDTDLGSQGGNHSITADQLPAHTHSYNLRVLQGEPSSTVGQPEAAVVNGGHMSSVYDAFDTHDNETDNDPYTPPYTAVNYIIYT